MPYRAAAAFCRVAGEFIMMIRVWRPLLWTICVAAWALAFCVGMVWEAGCRPVGFYCVGIPLKAYVDSIPFFGAPALLCQILVLLIITRALKRPLTLKLFIIVLILEPFIGFAFGFVTHTTGGL